MITKEHNLKAENSMERFTKTPKGLQVRPEAQLWLIHWTTEGSYPAASESQIQIKRNVLEVSPYATSISAKESGDKAP